MRGVAQASLPAGVPARACAQPYVEYHPVFGYRYRENLDWFLPRPGGASYHFKTNADGIRASRDYSRKKPSGVRRIVLCGDSMSAGQFVSNELRLSEQLERLIPNLEVVNLSLEGSGTDQQLLLYEEIGRQYEHDAVVLMPFVSNLRRNMAEAREAINPISGNRSFRGKPRFDLVAGELQLRNVPVPENLPVERSADVITDTARDIASGIKSRLSATPGASLMKKIAYSVVPWEPFAEFRSAASPEWQMMEAIVRRFKASAGERPLVVVPTFYDSYVRFRISRAYWRRFQSLTRITGVHAVDLLPYFKRLGRDATLCFQAPFDSHFSAYGHLVIANALAEKLRFEGEMKACSQ